MVNVSFINNALSCSDQIHNITHWTDTTWRQWSNVNISIKNFLDINPRRYQSYKVGTQHTFMALDHAMCLLTLSNATHSFSPLPLFLSSLSGSKWQQLSRHIYCILAAEHLIMCRIDTHFKLECYVECVYYVCTLCSVQCTTYIASNSYWHRNQLHQHWKWQMVCQLYGDWKETLFNFVYL